jgi:uracil-DNA glycosylase
LWGKDAQEKEKLIDKNINFIFKSSHPSPLSSYRGFFGCKHFSLTNELLIKNKKQPILW